MRSPSQPVSENADRRSNHADGLRVDRLARVVLQHRREIRRQVREEQTVEAAGAGQQRAADRDVPEVGLQQLAERLTRGEAAHPLELRRFLQRAAQDETQHAAETAEDERDAPSVDRNQRRIHPRSHRQAHTRRHRHAHRHAREHHAAHKRRDAWRGFDDVGQRAGQLAAKAEALDQSQRHHQQAGRHTPLRVATAPGPCRASRRT